MSHRPLGEQSPGTSLEGATPSRARGGRAFEALVEGLAPDLLAHFARRVRPTEDAADLLSECLVVLWRAEERLPDDPREARMWAFGVAREVLYTHRRTHVRKEALLARVRGELAAAHTWVGSRRDSDGSSGRRGRGDGASHCSPARRACAQPVGARPVER